MRRTLYDSIMAGRLDSILQATDVTIEEVHPSERDSSDREPELVCPFCIAPNPILVKADHGVRRYRCLSCYKFWATL